MAWLKRALAACASDMHGNRFNRLVPPLLNRFFELRLGWEMAPEKTRTRA
jgi:hypothetical protein